VGTTLYFQCDIPHYHDTGNIQVHLDTNVNSSYLNVLSTQHSLPSTNTALKDIITAPYWGGKYGTHTPDGVLAEPINRWTANQCSLFVCTVGCSV